jgi:hypothetical protein
MNKLYCFLLLLVGLALPGRAQSPTGSLRQQLDYHFANLDKSQVPTRLLAEYARPLVPLTYFDGSLADSNRTNASLFRALYATAASACIYGASPLPTLPDFNQRVQAAEAASETVIPVMVARLDYASVRPDAFSQNLLSLQNGQVYDVPGRTQSPYQTRTLFAAAPSREVARTGNVTLVLPSSLYVVYNIGFLSLVSQAIDFGDGRGYLPATWDQPIGATYAANSSYTLRFRLTCADGSVLLSHARLDGTVRG